MHAMEVPYTFDIPAALVGDKVTAADKAMAAGASAYWVSFAKTGDPNGDGRTAWPRYDPSVDRIINFTNAGVVVGPDPLKARLGPLAEGVEQWQLDERPRNLGLQTLFGGRHGWRAITRHDVTAACDIGSA